MRHQTTIKLRFGDTDMLGHINNASYFTYMEDARLSFVESLGVKGGSLIIASAKVDWKKQTYFPDTLQAETFVTRIGKSSFDVASVLTSENTGDIVFEGVAVLVYFDYESNKPVRIPEEYRERLMEYFEPAASDK